MHGFAQYALPGTILASAVGAVVLCLVLLLYGFKSEPDDERSPARRLLLIRGGHALAAACFGAALMLSVTTFIDREAVDVQEPARDVQWLKAQVRALERRLAAAESRLMDVRVPVSMPIVPAIEPTPRRPAPAPRAKTVASTRPPRTSAVASANGGEASPATHGLAEDTSVPPAASPPRALPAAATPPATGDLGAKMRDDWESVKRGFREAGRDIQTGFADLGRRIKRTFD